MYVGKQVSETNIDKKELEKYVDKLNKNLVANLIIQNQK